MSPFVWLLIGALLSAGYHGRWTIPFAPWLALTVLMHFTHVQPAVPAFLWTWLALLIAYGIVNRGVMPLPPVPYVTIMTVVALLPALAFLADRLLTPRLPGFASTLVFPLVWGALEFLSSRRNPFGTWGTLGYTQYGNLPLTQVVSITGVVGISFLIAWCAAVVNRAWDSQWQWAAAGPEILGFLGILSATYLWGGARLMRRRRDATTVRIAGIGWPGAIERRDVVRLYRPDLQLSEAEAQQLRQGFQRTADAFLEDTRREARAGARIVVWPEASALVFAEDEQSYLDRARAVAREERIHLLIGMGTIHVGAHLPIENKAVLIDPNGAVRASYLKTTAAGGEAAVNRRGTEPVPTVDTTHGRVSSPICFDMDFPPVIRAAGRARSDLLLVPASDWAEIARLHLAMATFRAVENGAAMVRVTRWGHSAATDPYGRTLAFMDDAATSERTLVAQVPVRAGVRTPYARFGDWFGWSCVAGALLLLIRSLMR